MELKVLNINLDDTLNLDNNFIKYSDINNIKLGVKYDIININIDNDYTNISETIQNILRLCHINTKIILKDNKYVGYAIRVHNSKFRSIKYSGDNIILKLNEDILINFDKKLPTIITGLFNIRKMENNEKGDCKHIDEYLQRGIDLLELEIPIIIYTEISLIDKIKEIRPLHLHDITKFIIFDFKDTYYYKYIGHIEENKKKFKINNEYVPKDTPIYYTLGFNKFYFIDESIKTNPFNTTHFIWIDFGISHVAKNVNSIRRWIYNIPDKIRQLEINPFIENVEYKIYFENTLHNMAGGLISGNIDNLKKYTILFDNKLRKILNDGWHQLEEAIMAIIKKENNEIFDNFYGDYQNIMSGYDYYFKLNDENMDCNNYNIIMRSMHKCLNSGNQLKAYQILNYIKYYSLYNNKKNEDYINQYVICNYYVSSKKELDGDVINSINISPLSIKWVNNLLTNLKFYTNFSNIIKE
jgi:hypothetical protein